MEKAAGVAIQKAGKNSRAEIGRKKHGKNGGQVMMLLDVQKQLKVQVGAAGQ